MAVVLTQDDVCLPRPCHAHVLTSGAEGARQVHSVGGRVTGEVEVISKLGAWRQMGMRCYR
jgi:hypothetical protein